MGHMSDELEKALPLVPDKVLRRSMGDRYDEAADMRYDDEDADAVARIFVRVEYKGGRIREYEAEDPQDFKINDPETEFTMTPMRMSVQAAGSPFVPMMAATPLLRLSFRGGARRPMHIRTEATAAPSRRDAEARVDDQPRTVRLGKDAITGGGDTEVDGDPALPESGVDLAEETPGIL